MVHIILVSLYLNRGLCKGNLLFNPLSAFAASSGLQRYSFAHSILNCRSFLCNSNVISFFVGDNAVIVIGGDDNYENEDEEDKEFISRWAKRKVSSRFSEEFLDGRKRFIFSWNKKHREIHEEALVHFFEKKGQKFEYQPKRKLLPRPATPPPAKAADPVEPSRLYSTLPESPSSRERARSADTILAGRNKAPHTGEQVIKAKEVPPSGARRDMPKGQKINFQNHYF